MEGSTEFRILKDRWTAVSADDKRYVVENQKYIQDIILCLHLAKWFSIWQHVKVIKAIKHCIVVFNQM